MFVISVQTWANRRGDLPESPCLFLWGSAGASLRLSERKVESGFELFRAKAGSQLNLRASALAEKTAIFLCQEFFS